MINWPHQDYAREQSRMHWRLGTERWCVVGPTGSGKTKMQHDIAKPAADQGYKTHIYSHRIMLTRQILLGLGGADVGVIAAGFHEYYNPDAPIQICALQTVHAGCKKGGKFYLPHADILIIDEAHQQTKEMAKQVFGLPEYEAARKIGFTATPVGLKESYDALVLAGSYDDMLKCGAHLPYTAYGPDCPDTSKLKPSNTGEFSRQAVGRLMKPNVLFGRVYDHWKRYNPNALPAILFAPGVAQSRWFVDLFTSKGVPCAHIDSDTTAFSDGRSVKEYDTDDSTRQDFLGGLADGTYKVGCNRFILREAIDIPEIYQCILATAFGGLSTYLQATGRTLRSYPKYKSKIFQDHGGNIDRHGMPTENRQWTLDSDNRQMHKQRKQALEKKKDHDAEPIRCKKCGAYRTHGRKCVQCGHRQAMSVRAVWQTDGTLREVRGRVVKYKPPKSAGKYWRSALYAVGNKGGTVGQAVGYAGVLANRDGKVIEHGDVDFPPRDQWQKAVRELYPWVTRT